MDWKTLTSYSWSHGVAVAAHSDNSVKNWWAVILNIPVPDVPVSCRLSLSPCDCIAFCIRLSVNL